MFKKTTLWTAMFALALSLGSCGGGGSDYESVMQDQVNVFNELNEILADITDQASAEAAKPKIEALGEEMKALQAKMSAMDEPTQEELNSEEIKELSNQIGQATMTMGGHMARIGLNPMNRGAMDSLGDSLDAFKEPPPRN
jgi:hypothetical protein